MFFVNTCLPMLLTLIVMNSENGKNSATKQIDTPIRIQPQYLHQTPHTGFLTRKK